MSCPPELAAIERELAPGGLVVFGEMHGTHEAPAFVASAAELAATRGPVVVALEIPDDVQPGIDAYLARKAGLVSDAPFWTYDDGRAGEALVALLDRLRTIGARVVCFDGVFATAEARDEGMAAAILDGIAGDPNAAWLVSCGNLHARTDAPRWMGWHLRARRPALVSLNIEYDGGAAWVSTGEAGGVHELGRPRGDARRGVERFDARDDRGHDGVYRVGTLTPSWPLDARDVGAPSRVDARGKLAEEPFDVQFTRDKVLVRFRGRLVRTLVGADADAIRAVADDPYELQLAVARKTGNFKRGNER